LVYGNPATELPLLVERFSVARGDAVAPGWRRAMWLLINMW
jgi:hypothetical protein